jgi:hypothetical protein
MDFVAPSTRRLEGFSLNSVKIKRKPIEEKKPKNDTYWRGRILCKKFELFQFPKGNPFDAPELRLGVEACRLVGLDPDQLSLQAPFPEGLPAPIAGSPMAR